MSRNSVKLDEYADMVWGTSAGGYGKQKIKLQNIHYLIPEETNMLNILDRDIKRYDIKWAGEYIPKKIFSDASEK